ncbi:lasso RiPP family leader peptide-containing protein [Actinomadura kijaniata]|nr:lasso RiPP family leader peptide-containing protein [Actinomadura kijaniata]
MEQKTEAYEPPTLTEVGDFASLTLGRGMTGFEAEWTCFVC